MPHPLVAVAGVAELPVFLRFHRHLVVVDIDLVSEQPHHRVDHAPRVHDGVEDVLLVRGIVRREQPHNGLRAILVRQPVLLSFRNAVQQLRLLWPEELGHNEEPVVPELRDLRVGARPERPAHLSDALVRLIH